MRKGFTLLEILIALLIGGPIVMMAIQQTFSFFHIQAVLMARTQLRGETQLALDKIDQQLRYAIMLEQMPDNDGYVIVVPKDVDHCGRICNFDTYDMAWFRVRPSSTGLSSVLQEQLYTMPAFKDEPDLEVLERIYATVPKATHTIADSIDSLSISVEGSNLYHSRIFASRSAPGDIKVGLQEDIAPRSLPMAMDSTPVFKDVVTKLVNASVLPSTVQTL